MTQDEINQAEWANSENWHGPRWLSVYVSKKDSRTWVPKQIPWMGLWRKKATPNLAHTGGVLSLLGILLAILTVAVVLVRISGG